jgi:hypothetical protein
MSLKFPPAHPELILYHVPSSKALSVTVCNTIMQLVPDPSNLRVKSSSQYSGIHVSTHNVYSQGTRGYPMNRQTT